jgi:hypothetical protein
MIYQREGLKMKMIRPSAKMVSVFLTILMLSITIPYQSVMAAMIATEATLDSMRAQQVRDDINNLLLREDIQKALIAQGIDPLEAKARIDSLSDTEIVRIANQIDKLPAGGGDPTPPQNGKDYESWEILVGLLLFAIIALIIFALMDL